MFSLCVLFKTRIRPQHYRKTAVTFLFIFFFWVFIHRRLSEHELLKWMTLDSEAEKDPLLNGHRFTFSLDVDICHQRNVDVVIFVHTAVGNFVRRMKSRDTWAAVTRVDGLNLGTVFMVGQTTNQSMQRLLNEESRTHRDIVQANFIDTYENLTYKHIMSLGWIKTHCPDAKMIVKVDNDVIVNVFNMAAFFRKYGFPNNLLYCVTYYYAFPKRIYGHKWYVGYADYPFVLYPTFCSGEAYLMSPAIADKLYEASRDVRFFWIDDLYVTGFLALKVGVTPQPLVQGHDIANSSKLMRNSMFVEAQHVWYSQWDYILRYAPKNVSYSTKSCH